MSFSVIVNSESDSDAGHSFRNHVFETNLTNDLITSLIRYAPNTKRIVALVSIVSIVIWDYSFVITSITSSYENSQTSKAIIFLKQIIKKQII